MTQAILPRPELTLCLPARAAAFVAKCSIILSSFFVVVVLDGGSKQAVHVVGEGRREDE
jgi:hypothetical protein